MIWLAYQKDSGFTTDQDFFIFCDESLKDVTLLYPARGEKVSFEKNTEFTSIEEWKESFDKEAIFIVSEIKKLPKSITEFK